MFCTFSIADMILPVFCCYVIFVHGIASVSKLTQLFNNIFYFYVSFLKYLFRWPICTFFLTESSNRILFYMYFHLRLFCITKNICDFLCSIFPFHSVQLEYFIFIFWSIVGFQSYRVMWVWFLKYISIFPVDIMYWIT